MNNSQHNNQIDSRIEERIIRSSAKTARIHFLMFLFMVAVITCGATLIVRQSKIISNYLGCCEPI
jgi:Ca2+/Na+ antiporter